MEFNLADLFEHAADNFPDREYLVANGERRTYREMDERANRLAHHLAEHGVGEGDHVGIYAYNCVEWVETLWAVFKLRAIWININYRYVEDELKYVFADADLVALVHQREFAPRVAYVRDQLPRLGHVVVIEDGSDAEVPASAVGYEQAMASASPDRDFGPRSADDRYILYTGGTTGMPKGVVWRHEDVFMALGGGIDAYTREKAARPEVMVEKGKARDSVVTNLPIAPLMHGMTQWSVMANSFTGNKVVLMAKFDANEVWRLVTAERVNSLMISGDAMGRPLIEAITAPGADHDTSTFFVLASSAAIFSPDTKDAFLRRFPNLVVVDSTGSSETGMTGITVVAAGSTAMRGGPTVTAGVDAVVLDDNLRPLPPGTGQVGVLARGGNIPVGYLNDPVKTAATFVTTPDGRRYAISGDAAIHEADGRITMLGRGSVSINSGGEKIFPEEVEAAVKSHPGVYDVTVVGVPDERWGQRVVAVIAFREGHEPTLEEIQTHCRTRIAGYKVPRGLHPVPAIVRSPAGKPDYRWAKAVATAEAVPTQPTPTEQGPARAGEGDGASDSAGAVPAAAD